MLDLDKIQLSLSLNEIKKSIKDIQLKIESSSNTDELTNIREEILKEITDIKIKINTAPKTQSSEEIKALEYAVEQIQQTLTTEVCPSVNQWGSIDASFLFNNILGNVTDTNKKLCEVSGMTAVNSATLDSMSAKLSDISTSLDTSTNSSILISYPVNGTVTLSSGNTVFNFSTGVVTNVDNSTSSMSDALDNYLTQYARSFVIYVDKAVSLTVNGSKSTVLWIPAGSFRMVNTEVNRVTVLTYTNTNIWISVSMLPEGAPYIEPIQLPTSVIDGTKTNISTTASQIVTTTTPIGKAITLKVRSLGTGTYIAVGNATSQSFRLKAVGDSIDIVVDDLNKVYTVTDAGSTGSLEYFGA